MIKKMLSNTFDYNDFLKQYKTISGMGGMASMVKMLPGMNKIEDKQLTEVEKKYAIYETIISVRIIDETVAFRLCRMFVNERNVRVCEPAFAIVFERKVG